MSYRTWFYLVAQDTASGQPYLLGKYESGKKAREIGFLKLSGQGVSFEVREYPTADLSEATRMFRHERLMKTGNITESVGRVRHTIPTMKPEINQKPVKF